MEKLKKPLIIVTSALVIFILFMFILASCNKKNYTSEEFSAHLLEKAKEYYVIHKDLLPKNDGGKTNISIATLVEKPEKFIGKDKTCSGSIDVINNNGYYIYTPNINCSDGYKTEKLSAHLISNDSVTSGNGLYNQNDYYIYRGESIDNYLIFNKQLWRIIKINSDSSIKIIETNYVVKSNKKDKIEYKSNKRVSTVWDNRHNVEKSYSAGFNDYVHEGLNSRIKDTLEDIYENEYSDKVKGYIVAQDLCVGKRASTDSINDGSIECSSVLNAQYIGLIQLNEYISASLDNSCINAESSTCSNYNYLSTFKSTFWTITGVSENTYDVYKVGNKISDATANSNATPRVVINLSGEVAFNKGTGTYENPYIID